MKIISAGGFIKQGNGLAEKFAIGEAGGWDTLTA